MSSSRGAQGRANAGLPPAAAQGGPGGRRRLSTLGAGVVALAVALAVVVVVLASGGSSPARGPSGDAYPNVNASNTRAVGGPLDAADVSRLKLAWTVPISGVGDYGDYSATPTIGGGVVYSQDMASNVQAIDLDTGRVIWSKYYEARDHGPNGLVVAGGRVFGTTPTSIFALDRSTGRQLWLDRIASGEPSGVDMAPGYASGIVYVSTVAEEGNTPSGAQNGGVLWAIQASTGRTLWKFDTVPASLAQGRSTAVNWGGGLWYTPAFDGGGSMYFGVANPQPALGSRAEPWASGRPGPDLYTDSLVKLDADSGRLQWYYQSVPHDVYDWDLQDPPMLLDAGGRPLVVAAGKSGQVLALDRSSGKLVWERSVGLHNGHDHDSGYAMRHEYSKLKLPETVYPGRLGGVIAPMASDGSTVFAPVVNLPQRITPRFSVEEPNEKVSGELVAIDAGSGAVRWTHHFPSPVFSGVTVVNDVVFTATFAGVLYALDARSGRLLWQTSLPAGTNGGVAVEGDTVVVPAGFTTGGGQEPSLLAYRLPGR